jgi:hypothetical protein
MGSRALNPKARFEPTRVGSNLNAGRGVSDLPHFLGAFVMIWGDVRRTIKW